MVSERNKSFDDLASARKWAKLWKMQATGERIQKEQCIDALADVTHERNKLLDQQVVSRVNINSAHKEIERLNGRRCDTCKHGTPYYGPDQMKVKSAIWCTVNSGMDERVSKRFEFGEHYCKSWEKR